VLNNAALIIAGTVVGSAGTLLTQLMAKAITAGAGWVQREGGPVEEVRAGDVVRIPPGVKHWHGATRTMRMTHIALQEQLDGKVVEWMEHVSDEQYRRP
jgi:cupin superfamily acireductone dioxygenase involved in methionine salvage